MDIKKRTEALLLAANRALSVKDIVELLETQSAEEESEVLSAVVSLKEDYADKPYDLVEVSSGYRIQLNQDYSKDIAKLWEVKPLRLSRATLETLSIITYMQPVTRGDIENAKKVPLLLFPTVKQLHATNKPSDALFVKLADLKAMMSNIGYIMDTRARHRKSILLKPPW